MLASLTGLALIEGARVAIIAIERRTSHAAPLDAAVGRRAEVAVDATESIGRREPHATPGVTVARRGLTLVEPPEVALAVGVGRALGRNFRLRVKDELTRIVLLHLGEVIDFRLSDFGAVFAVARTTGRSEDAREQQEPHSAQVTPAAKS